MELEGKSKNLAPVALTDSGVKIKKKRSTWRGNIDTLLLRNINPDQNQDKQSKIKQD